MKKLISIIRIIRPINGVITFAVVFVGGYLASGMTNAIQVFTACMTAFFSASAGNIINDIYDIEIDKINRPERPLPSGAIALYDAKVIYYGFVTIGLITSLYIGTPFLIIAAVINLLLFLYSFNLKRKPFAGNIIIAFITAAAFLYGSMAGGDVSAGIVPASFAFLINLIREMLKDIEDIKGDMSGNAVTAAVKYGEAYVKKGVLYLTILLIAVTFIPFVTQYYKIDYFVVIQVIVNPLLIYFISGLLKTEKVNYRKLSILLKIVMFAGLIAIWSGK